MLGPWAVQEKTSLEMSSIRAAGGVLPLPCRWDPLRPPEAGKWLERSARQGGVSRNSRRPKTSDVIS